MSERLTKALDEVARAMRRLEVEQGRIARGNARRAVLAGLRRLRAELDDTYPALIKPTAGKRRKRAQQPSGYDKVYDAHAVAALSPLGVKIYKMPKGVPPRGTVATGWLVPDWAMHLWRQRRLSEVRGAVASRKKREALRTEIALARIPSSSGATYMIV